MIEALFIFIILLTLYILLRNERISEHQSQILQIIRDKAEQDIQNEREWEWRYDDYSKVSYTDMVLRFWKPIDSFYTDKRFLE
jgi:hypothetical protein